jgi:putative two-component system response regulator
MIDSKNRKRILVVDDEPGNIDIMTEILKSDYTVLAARDGVEALSIAASNAPPDLVMLDIMMPGMDGYEVLRRLRANPRTAGLPVIMVTARDKINDKMKGYALGVTDYITKPHDGAFVLNVVRRLLGAHPAPPIPPEAAGGPRG